MTNLSDSESAAFSAAASLFEVESESSRHYERMRSNITQFNVAICAAFVGGSTQLEVPVTLSVPFLILQAAVMWFASKRATQAHAAHFSRAKQMRKALYASHPMLTRRGAKAEREWRKLRSRGYFMNRLRLMHGRHGTDKLAARRYAGLHVRLAARADKIDYDDLWNAANLITPALTACMLLI